MRKMPTQTFDNIIIIAHGEEPWRFEGEPRIIPGPWTGRTVEEAVQAAGLDPAKYRRWLRDYEPGGDLWVAPLGDAPSELTDEQREAMEGPLSRMDENDE